MCGKAISPSSRFVQRARLTQSSRYLALKKPRLFPVVVRMNLRVTARASRSSRQSKTARSRSVVPKMFKVSPKNLPYRKYDARKKETPSISAGK